MVQSLWNRNPRCSIRHHRWNCAALRLRNYSFESHRPPRVRRRYPKGDLRSGLSLWPNILPRSFVWEGTKGIKMVTSGVLKDGMIRTTDCMKHHHRTMLAYCIAKNAKRVGVCAGLWQSSHRLECTLIGWSFHHVVGKYLTGATSYMQEIQPSLDARFGWSIGAWWPVSGTSGAEEIE